MQVTGLLFFILKEITLFISSVNFAIDWNIKTLKNLFKKELSSWGEITKKFENLAIILQQN